ncbi:MAG: HAMP domain-containing histidine kinase, partial [Spirochaetales bacterium]|nr:HAMP domain-containing histidine kinase [Spirochaetales bacterium]
NAKNGRMGNKEKTPLSVFKNKIVLIAKDFQKDKIPLPNNFGNTVFGGLVHAYGIQTLLDGASMRRIPLLIELLILLILLVCIQTLLNRIKGVLSILSVILLCFIMFIIQVVLFQTMNYWLLFGPLFIEAIVSMTLYSSYRRYTLGKEFNHINTQVKRLTQFNSQLEEAGKLKDILTDTLVHDIKNAIAAIEGSLYFITEKYKEDSQSLEIFHAASIACTDIINLSSNLLDVRKIEEGKCDLVKEACSLEQISGIIERFTNYPLFYEKKIRVKINPFDQSLSITPDMYLMEQIIHNLLNNALKYTPVNGEIIISFKHTPDKGTILTFFNSGKPISDDVKETIFEKYKRGKNKRSKYSKGLGLYFCKMAMEMMEGRIWLETDETGNYFKLEFTA